MAKFDSSVVSICENENNVINFLFFASRVTAYITNDTINSENFNRQLYTQRWYHLYLQGIPLLPHMLSRGSQVREQALYARILISSKGPDRKVHGANMGPISGRQDPGGPHDGPMNLAIWGICCAYH